MAGRQGIFHGEARAKLLRGVDIVAAAVMATLGPSGRTGARAHGRTVVRDRAFGAPQIVNSGVLVARTIALEDRFEHMGAQMLRDVAARTSGKAGDGTTTATVLAHLRTLARPCASTQDIAHVGAISANNDCSIGDLLARAIDKVGREGAISIAPGDNAAGRTCGNLPQMGVIDPAKVTRLALQNAASIAALVPTTGCMAADAAPPHVASGPGMPGGLAPEV